MRNKNIIRVALGAGLILLIPLALQLTIGTGVDGQGFNWTPSDFIVMGALLFGTGLALEFTIKKLKNSPYRIAAGIAIIAVFIFIWAELAVGVLENLFARS